MLALGLVTARWTWVRGPARPGLLSWVGFLCAPSGWSLSLYRDGRRKERRVFSGTSWCFLKSTLSGLSGVRRDYSSGQMRLPYAFVLQSVYCICRLYYCAWKRPFLPWILWVLCYGSEKSYKDNISCQLVFSLIVQSASICLWVLSSFMSIKVDWLVDWQHGTIMSWSQAF